MIKNIFSKIVFIPFLLPIIYQIKFPIKNWGSLNLLDLVLIICTALGATLVFKQKKVSKFQKYLSEKIYFKIFLLLLLWIFLVILVNFDSNWLRNLGLLKSFFILPIFFSLILGFFIQEKLIKTRHILINIFIYSSSLGLATIIASLLGETSFDNRVSLFFQSPNQLAMSLALGFICGLFLLNKKRSLLFLGLLLAILQGILLTKSAAALGSIILIGVIFLFFKKSKWLPLILKSIFVVSIFISAFLFLFLNFTLQKTDHDPFLNKNSFDSRLAIYLSTKKIAEKNLFTGIGLSNFQDHYLKNQSFFPPYPQWAVPHAHNFWMQILVSQGLIGLFIWVYLLSKKIFSKKPPEKIFIIFLLYFLIHGMVDVPIWSNDLALFFWFILFL